METTSSTQKNDCCFCRLPRASHECGICESDICRSCAERVAEDTFLMQTTPPEWIDKKFFCPRCFDDVIAPVIASYEEKLALAKEVHYWPKNYRGYIPVLRKSRTELRVENAKDRDEALLQLGFLAVEAGFNGMVQGEISSRKVRNFGYQNMSWSARALPVMVDNEKLERNEFRETIY
jgi:hypothetical protein